VNRLRIADVCAGIGGIRIGFERIHQNIKCVYHSEIDKFCNKTYSINFNQSVESTDITNQDINYINDHDILLSGFPCQPYSKAGKKLGLKDDRASVILSLIKILRIKKPKAFLFENVANLTNHDNGNTLDFIINEIKNAGYHVYHKVLISKYYGVPQNRKRLYIVGFLNINNFSFPDNKIVNSNIKDILESNVDNKYYLSDKLWQYHKERKKLHKQNGNGFGYNLIDTETDTTVPTLSARYGKDGQEILIKTNKNPRKLTPRECARLQGFSDDFIIPVSDTQAYKQFGNSVAVPVISAIAKNIVRELLL